MPRSPNLFIDPAGRVADYSWPINHTTEDQVGRSRQMADGAPTSNMGLIPQQGAATPLVLTWKGTILTKAHLQAMIDWWMLCEGQTIYVQDFAGSRYEVLITDFAPTRRAVARNPQDPTHAPYNVWDYTLTMRVVTTLSGEWTGVVP
jgi:hypothetical protein